MRKTDIIIFSGQSNMEGQTEAPMSSVPLHGSLEYHYLEDALVPLFHPVGEMIGDELLVSSCNGNGSLVPDFCRSYSEKTGNLTVAVHAARGATAIAEWLPPSDRFNALISKSLGAVNAVGMENLGKVWFVWLQGESDALESRTNLEYKERVHILNEALKQHIPIEKFCIIRVAKFAGDARDLEIIRAQEELGCEEDFLLLTRITGTFTNDTSKWMNPFAAGHYNNAAMTLLGSTAGNNLGLFATGSDFELEQEPYPEVLE